MTVKEILLLGDERLYQTSRSISEKELQRAKEIINDLHDTMMSFRDRYGFGRAIAAPQIGEPSRIIYMNFDGRSLPIINPSLEFAEKETFEMWDDCMSFPGLEVKLRRYKSCRLFYRDLDFKECVLDFTGDLAELLQHEYDHIDGILAVQRAIDEKSLRINKEKSGCF